MTTHGDPVLRLRMRGGTIERAPYEVQAARGGGYVVRVQCDFPVRPDHALAFDTTNAGRVIEVCGAEAQVFSTVMEAGWALAQWERQMRGDD